LHRRSAIGNRLRCVLFQFCAQVGIPNGNRAAAAGTPRAPPRAAWPSHAMTFS